MDNKQLEEAVEKILSNVLLAHHDDLSQEDDDRIGEAKEQICNLFISKYIEGYNLCRDEFTACLVGRMEGIEDILNDPQFIGELFTMNKHKAQAIKTMILGGEG